MKEQEGTSIIDYDALEQQQNLIRAEDDDSNERDHLLSKRFSSVNYENGNNDSENFKPASTFQQFKALFSSRMTSFKRNLRVNLAVALIPAVYVAISIGSARLQQATVESTNTNTTVLNYVNWSPMQLPYTYGNSTTNITAQPLLDYLTAIHDPYGPFTPVNFNTSDKLQHYLMEDNTVDKATHRFGAIQFDTLDYGRDKYQFVMIHNETSLNSLPTLLNMINNAIFNQLLSSKNVKAGPVERLLLNVHPLPAKEF
jgi:hypothetical protein